MFLPQKSILVTGLQIRRLLSMGELFITSYHIPSPRAHELVCFYFICSDESRRLIERKWKYSLPLPKNLLADFNHPKLALCRYLRGKYNFLSVFYSFECHLYKKKIRRRGKNPFFCIKESLNCTILRYISAAEFNPLKAEVGSKIISRKPWCVFLSTEEKKISKYWFSIRAKQIQQVVYKNGEKTIYC